MGDKMEEIIKAVKLAADRIKKGENFDKVAREEYDKFNTNTMLDAAIDRLLMKDKGCDCPGCFVKGALKEYAINSTNKDLVDFKQEIENDTKKHYEMLGMVGIESKKKFFSIELASDLVKLKDAFSDTVLDYLVLESCKSFIKQNSNTNKKGE